MGLVDAIWVGPSGYTLADGKKLERGETVCKISRHEASDSTNWLLVSDLTKSKGNTSTTETTE